MSQPRILVFLRTSKTVDFLWDKFRQLPYGKILEIQNPNDEKYNVERVRSGFHWLSLETLLIFFSLLLAAAFYYQAWLSAVLIAFFSLASYFLLIPLKRLLKGQDSLVKRYKNLIMRGETLIIVECDQADFGKFIQTLRKIQDEPITFFSIMEPREKEDNPGKEMLPHSPETDSELEKQAKGLSTMHWNVSFQKKLSLDFLSHLSALSTQYQDTYKQLNNFASYNDSIQLSAEWFLDNAHTIRQSISDVQKNLPEDYIRELPFIVSGSFQGTPTLYPLISRLVAASDGKVTAENIELFLTAYQENRPLTMGELWAFPLVLKIRLIECLVNLTGKILDRVEENQSADFWANRILNSSRTDSEKLYSILSILSKEIPYPSTYFADQLMIQLTDTEAANTVILGWLQRKVGENLRDIIQVEQSRQTLEQTSIANVISSLRRLEQMNWRVVFEKVSIVEHILDKDPAQKYSEMDFPTKDSYRHVVEKLAKANEMPEEAVASAAISLAESQTTPLTRHVGYYLLDEGKPVLENATGFNQTFWDKVAKGISSYLPAIYLSACIGITVILAALFDYAFTPFTPGLTLIFLLLSLIPLSELAIQVINYITVHCVPPDILPKMEYNGIPEQYRTLVVIPTLLSSEKGLRNELEKIEVHYLANVDPQIGFGIVFDFTDSKEEAHHDDDLLLKLAKEGIRLLNTKYEDSKFYLFHRERKFNGCENAWIGWERKRGKLDNLNSFLMGNENAEFDSFLQEGESSFLAGIRYILTADSDTQLPKDSVKRLIETLSHPLNMGYFDPVSKKMLRGYSIIQPRVSTNYLSSNATWFAKLFSDPSGIDPYTKFTSDVYQDLFKEGVYHGKGLYDYKLFHEILFERLPENTILSHDLLEGSYVRTAFASDIEFYDSFPETYTLYAKRQHRWVRGDWQLLSWIGPAVPTACGTREKNPLSPINRWKIFDNLRRSLLPITALAAMFLSWFTPLFLPWTLLILTVIALPIALRIIDLSWITVTSKLGSVSLELFKGLTKTVATFIFMPHAAWINANAIGKALYRQYFSHRNLLQWTPSSSLTAKDTSCSLQLMIIAGASLLALVFFFLKTNPGLAIEFPILALWMLSPLANSLLNQPYLRDTLSAITPAYEKYLRMAARKTWRYFDDFVTEETHYLPPDNYQEKLKTEVAYRTSPTNIGLYMTSAICACRFGYMTVQSLIHRLSNTLMTLKNLERYEGHFLNWYDIKNISPLLPKYVSTVDSGNLLASFWTAEERCGSILNEPVVDAEAVISAINDIVNILKECLIRHDSFKSSFNFSRLISQAYSIRKTPAGLKQDLEALRGETNRCIAAFENPKEESKEIFYWLKQLEAMLGSVIAGIDETMPWIGLLLGAKTNEITLLYPEGIVWKQQAVEAIEKFPTFQDLSARNIPGLIPFFGWVQTLAAAKLDRDTTDWIKEFTDSMNQCFAFAEKFTETVNNLSKEIHEIGQGMNLDFLYNKERKLFSIGYNLSDQRLDNSYYDLLASEARLASFIAIAKGDVPLDHWWSLGRPTTEAFGMIVIQSWGGTMFEYLMPVIWCKNYNNTLLDYACKTAVKCQIAYGNQLGIPWGISESAYSRLDIHNIYQYRPFGVPHLGLKPGLENDFVVTPYSSALAMMIDPIPAIKNLKRLDKEHMGGTYGFFESIDYSMEYKPKGSQGIIIHAYMAHHLGMTISSLCNTLCQGHIQELFHGHPRVKALESILYERPDLPEGKVSGRIKEQVFPKLSSSATSAGYSHFETPMTPIPVTHILSNGNYCLMMTNSGSGYSKFHNVDITRWRVDATCDNWGTCFYIRDVERNAFFSAATYPTGSLGHSYAVNFSNHNVEISKREMALEAVTEIVVSPEDNVEIRCMTLSNFAMRFREIEVTSYVEIALAEHKADLIHPAFSKMFIETEAVEDCEGLLAQRRKRSPDDPDRWCFHVAALDNGESSPFSYETRRDVFLGYNRTLANPEKISADLSNTIGYVLDPIFALRKKIRLEAGGKTKVSFITGFAYSREEALQMLNKYKNIEASKRALDMAWAHAELDLRRLHITHDEAHLFQRLANAMIYPDVRLRASAEILKANRFGQDKLWGLGISGDNPILLVTIDDIYNIEIVHSALAAHAFWSLRGLKADLVIMNRETTSYEKPLNEHLVRIIQAYAQYTGINTDGGIFLIEEDKLPKEDLNLIYTVAHAVLVAEKGTLSQQLATPRRIQAIQPLLIANEHFIEEPSPPLPFLELLFYNGLGGFTTDGKEYAIFYEHGTSNLAPWINVICNRNFGFLASAKGLGMTWHENSQMNRLAPWSNDATLNPITDICYLRDDDSGKFWTVASSPILENDPFRARHGNGYTIYEHNSHAIEQELTVFVPIDESHSPVRIQILKLTNRSSQKRKLSIFTYIELTLDQEREESQRYIETSWNYEFNGLTALNYYRPSAFAQKVAFLTSSPTPVSYTGNRKDFIGRNLTTKAPDALKRSKLSQRIGVAMDPCFGLQNTVELYPNESTEVVILFGECSNVSEAKRVCNHFKDINNAKNAFSSTKNWWDRIHSIIQIKTPDQSLDILFNRWLTYQNISCRMWARSAFYQSGGAYGFRDQLQDAAALVYLDPGMTKEQILKAAGRQFVEGDVQHWWHQETGSGVRTRISDDLLWLPYVVMHYIEITRDESIMEIVVPYIEARKLEDNEHDAIVIPTQSQIQGSIKDHCLKAIEKSLTVGPHGLPLIGGGDWNDGMNLVGFKGQGESVWLAWFLIFILKKFSAWLSDKGDVATAKHLADQADKLLNAIEEHAWDGNWYIRAFFDNGAPIGSHLDKEDKIDSLPQSWAVIAGEKSDRVNSAMQSVEQDLIDEVHQLVLLFTPPYDKSEDNPGYIKGYPPGVRENGGQYTHAAVWVAMAFAKQGEGNKAMNVLQMINPINRTKNSEASNLYRVEPYVTAADIYALPGQEGRGGWTWYTGSASLMYRTLLEDVLGFKLQGDTLVIDPAIPEDWDSFVLNYRHGEAEYEIQVDNDKHVQKGVIRVELDGKELSDFKIPLIKAAGKHAVKVMLG